MPNDETCLVPYPAADPASFDEIKAHCYRGRKCWWFETACFCPHPDNHRYMHRKGAPRHQLLVFRDEERVGRDTIAACKAQEWRRWDFRSTVATAPDIDCVGTLVGGFSPGVDTEWCDQRCDPDSDLDD